MADAEESVSYPRTVEEAVSALLRLLPLDSKAELRDTSEGRLPGHHPGLGTLIRNVCGLWQGNGALLVDCGEDHPDDASMVIVRALWAPLQVEGHPPQHLEETGWPYRAL